MPRMTTTAALLALSCSLMAHCAVAQPVEAQKEPAKESPSNEELARQIEVLTKELESMKLGEAATKDDAGPGKGVYGLGPAASKVYTKKQGLSIGGYGESIYQAFESEKENGTAAGKTNEWDYLRAVLYVGWKFSPVFVLNTEIEYEHASTGKGGEVSVEFATLDALLSRYANVRAGMVLAPMGLVNEMHEPPTFLGARRPDVETQVIPSTWRMNGVGLFGEAGPVAYKLYVTESLNGTGFTASSGIRGGRQSGARAKADDLAVTGRADLVSVPGLLAGVSFFTGNTGQGLVVDGRTVEARTTLLDLHAEYRHRGLQVRGVFSRGTIDDAALLNRAAGLTGNKSIGETIEGWYLQGGYDVWPLLSENVSTALTPFVRYEEVDTQKSVPAGFSKDPANDRTILTAGLDFKPLPQIAVKLDYQSYKNEAKTGISQWNFAIGYLF
ncbi:MAG: hypothetical protein DIJKHBIC_04013 [Thermoanaerobaculia bacterium]|nr:hypothetical protein [Thermoanaerobaculia bacterium]